MAATSLAVGRFTPGVADRVISPRIRRQTRPVIFATDGGGDAISGPGWTQHVVDAVVGAGYRVYQPSVPYLVGNDTSRDRFDDALAYAIEDGCDDVPPLLLGTSNGATGALLWARDHDAAALVVILPPIDMAWIYDTNYADLRTVIGPAWGVTYPTPLPPEASPLAQAQAGAFDTTPIQLWYASNDPVTIAAGGAVTAFTAAAPDVEVHNVGALGHSAQAVAAVDPALVVGYLAGRT